MHGFNVDLHLVAVNTVYWGTRGVFLEASCDWRTFALPQAFWKIKVTTKWNMERSDDTIISHRHSFFVESLYSQMQIRLTGALTGLHLSLPQSFIMSSNYFSVCLPWRKHQYYEKHLVWWWWTSTEKLNWWAINQLSEETGWLG